VALQGNTDTPNRTQHSNSCRYLALGVELFTSRAVQGLSAGVSMS
jgi:hypothetical protein